MGERLDEEARSFVNTAIRCLDGALKAMNEAVRMTAEQGPAVAIEYIADYLNDTDAVDWGVADSAPDDWLTRWKVERA